MSYQNALANVINPHCILNSAEKKYKLIGYTNLKS